MQEENLIQYKPPVSYRDTSDRLGNLSEQFLKIKISNEYTINDVRYNTLTHCREATLSSRMITTFLANVAEEKFPSQQFESLVGVGPAQEASKRLSEASRLSLVVLYQFQVEYLYKSLIAALGENSPRGYYNIAKKILQILSLDDQDKKFRILYTPALIRNSYHSNGVHTDKNNPSWALDLDGCRFDFSLNQKISCAGWGHIVHALNAATLVLNEVLCSDKIKSKSIINF